MSSLLDFQKEGPGFSPGNTDKHNNNNKRHLIVVQL